MFFLAGNIYFLRCIEKETKQKNALEEEKGKLAFQVQELEIQQKEMEKQLKQEDAKQQETNLAKEEQDIEGLDSIQEVISNQTVSRMEKGECWAVYVKDLGSGIEKSSGQGKMQAASLIKLYIMGGCL